MRNGGAALLVVVVACGSEGTTDVMLRTDLVVEERVDFGVVEVGERASATLQLQNAGDVALSVERFDLSGDGAFSTGGVTLPIALWPGQTAHVPMTFMPTTRGRVDARVTIRATAASQIFREVDLTGEGAIESVRVGPASLDFGRVVSGETKTMQLTIENQGDATTLEFPVESEVRACEPNRAAAVCVDTGGALLPLEAGETKTIDVVFRARAIGAVGRRLVLETLGGERFEVAVGGIVVDNRLVCEAPSDELGPVNLGRCGAIAIPCVNASVDALVVASVETSEESTSFEVTSPMGSRVLEAAEALTIEVSFCPSDAGRDATTLFVETSQTEPERRTIEIEIVAWGGGADLAVSPRRLDFGRVSTVVPVTRDVLVSNVGTSQMWITTATVGAPFTAQFFGPRLQPGESKPVPVTFAPTTAGVVQAKLRLESNDPDSPVVEIDVTGEGIELSPCQYAVTATVAFGEVDVFRTLRRAVEIENVGVDRCLVSGARVASGSDEFVMPSEVRDLFVEPGEVTTVEVELTPTTLGAKAGELSIAISSPVSPIVIALVGSGVENGLLIAPDEVSFGAVDVTCTGLTRTVRIHNPGELIATIDAITMAPHVTFAIAALPPVPISIAPNGSVDLEVRFAPAAPGQYGGAVVLRGVYEGAPYERVVALEGRAGSGARQIDRHVQAGVSKADMLFVVDASGSVTDDLLELSASVGVMLDLAGALGVDYQIGVTTMDVTAVGGRLVHEPAHFGGPPENRIVTARSLPSPAEVLARNLAVGSGDSGTEAGLENGYLALRAPNVLGPNAGFLRPDASLGVVYVTDEDDQSSRLVELYADALATTKQDRNLVVASAVAGDVPGGCNGPTGPAQAGTAYASLVERMGGVFHSICSIDRAGSMLEVAEVSFGYRRAIALSSVAAPGSIVVRVDGTEVPTTSAAGTINWTYDGVHRRVRFTPFAVPEPGAEIEVDYAVACP